MLQYRNQSARKWVMLSLPSVLWKWLCLNVVERGLTLYDAIWHPHNIEWPLRGLLEHILLPRPLSQHDLSGIREAAYWMHASVQNMSDARLKEKLANHPFIKQTIADLQEKYQPARLPGRRRAPRQQMTVQAAQTAIRTWLYTRGFTGENQGTHRIEHEKVPRKIRDRGYIMPGFDTVVAGYLLPVVATEVPTVRDGVEYHGVIYQNAASGIEPGSSVTSGRSSAALSVPRPSLRPMAIRQCCAIWREQEKRNIGIHVRKEGTMRSEAPSEQPHEASQEEPSLSPIVPLKGRRVKSFETMTDEEWKALEVRGRGKSWYIELEQWMQRLIEAKANNRQSINQDALYGTGLRNQAAEAMKVTVWTIDDKLERYEANPCIDALLDRPPGPESSITLTEEQQGVILFVLIPICVLTKHTEMATDCPKTR
ncbi:MAG: hypothetical protein HC884_03855 [Chloroflexaceae bacterium]|nr:hypothetical protein [Chloroflexaceae bacterium]